MKIQSRGDTLDAEQLNELARNGGWLLCAARLSAARDQAIKDVINAKTFDDVKYSQGVIQALGMALAMPDQLAKEIRNKLKLIG